MTNGPRIPKPRNAHRTRHVHGKDGEDERIKRKKGDEGEGGASGVGANAHRLGRRCLRMPEQKPDLRKYWSTTWSSWRHLDAFGAQKGVFRVVTGRARHGSDQSGATPPSYSDLPTGATLPERQGEVARGFITRRRENEPGATSRSDTARSLPKPGATCPERQGEVARVFITRRRENEPGATSRSDTARSLPKPGATCRSDGLRSLRVLFLLELVISQGPFGHFIMHVFIF
ncbi:hypothetical protein IGI04_002995 [Brassica rapa subsp. trilocularis]|uniref:DUF4005 domain-containing protein n=1 Tax=Brassica rapa subsp. trilocularis TaxID=1813537 RepID=A0ABQ7NX41_BRACM|nr:hypothetical protein IGI04_002995 [Brassica rapa subsp. trilocularis]